MTHERENDPSVKSARRERALNQVAEALRDLQFGEIRVTVQDGVVVQVERTERKRLPIP